jgi:hypothetical protein
MAQTQQGEEHRDPLNRLSVNIFCEIPDVKDLTLEQKFALHEFFHSVLAAGYKLYQIVPAELAAAVIRKKFEHMIARE